MTQPNTTPAPLDSWQSAVEEAADFRDASPRQHYDAFIEACRLVTAILERHPEQAARYETQDPLPVGSHLLLARIRCGG